MSDSFEARGFAVIPEVLAESECRELALSLKQHAALAGIVAPGAVALRDAHAEVTVVVKRGGVLAMRPLLLHASSKALAPSFRRVLHFVFGPPALPYGLRWGQVA
jgi:hypothetical protein